MTSKSSSLVRYMENNKRRIWVWVVSLLAQLSMYLGVLAMYMSRIKFWHKDDAYATEALYKAALCDAVADAVGFNPIFTVLVTGLAIIIGIQGFSYLYDRKKIDMYHSVPVPSKSRFIVIGINGILAYVIPCLISAALAIIMATAQGGMNSRVLAECGLGLLVNFLYFMVVYTTVILAVMLTGNFFITAMAIGVFLLIGYLWQYFFKSLKYNFFETTCTFFGRDDIETTLSVYINHLFAMDYLRYAKELSDIVKTALPICGRWFVEMLIIGALAYLCYAKRPSEAAGKAIAYKVITPFLKVIIAPTVGLMLYAIVYDSSYSNVPFSVFGMIIGTLLCAGVMEVIYEFDIRAAIKHLVTTGISVVVAIAVFCIFYFDIFSYDAYLPDKAGVESIAISINPYANGYYKFSDDGIRAIGEGTYLKDNMFLTDTEPILELVRKSQESAEEMADKRDVYILYRLKSGREVSRAITVDFADTASAALLDRIMETKEYRESAYQIFKNPDIINRPDASISYKNGIVECNIPSKESGKLREAWLKDMENLNFSLVRNNLPCGYINIFYGVSYIRVGMPVYESFTNTIACLEENNAYYPSQIHAEDVLTLSVTNYNYVYDTEVSQPYRPAAVADTATESRMVSEDFNDPQEIAEIVKGLYSDYSNGWIPSDMLDNNYRVTISYKSNAGYPYVKGYNDYTFISGQVPDFVAERTAVTTEDKAE